MKSIHFQFSGRKLAALLFCLAFTPAALATEPLYQNYADLNYTISGNPPLLQIDATAFDNESMFSVTYNIWINNQVEFCEPWWNTRFFTNNGTMRVNAPFPTNGNFSFQSTGVGFEFDTQAGNSNVMAGTFYNSGAIRCDSILDGNNIYTFSDGTQSYFQTSIGECLVSATNIINPGNINVGVGGLMKLTGQNVDLSGSTLTLEQDPTSSAGLNLKASGAVGTDTNGDWNPSIDLGPTYALSSSPDYLYLTNSTSYFHTNGIGTSNVIIWGVFVQDSPNPNVTHNVYFSDTTPLVIGGGYDTIEWLGTHVDPATGVVATNYLYLNDVTELATNNFISAGVPDNFTFTATNAPIFIGSPSSSSFPSGVYADAVVTNLYSYVNAQFIPTTVATNASWSNPSGALTNLPDRIQISASHELNLALAQISGSDYLSLTSTNQFDGSGGAQISSPYADINLGVTNGFLMVSNLLESSIPNWNGTVQAWSARWFVVDTNGVTTDYRVLIVNSQITPTTPSQVQDFILHGTNIVISDAFNVLRTLSIDAQNLTLTTNGIGNGAGSVDGELNVENTGILWTNSLPNLRNLTNNGAIRLGNLAYFGGPPPNNYQTFINNNGLVSDQGSVIYANNFESSGAISNGLGSFSLQSQTVVLTNGSIIAGGNVSITADSLVTSNLMLQAGGSLTLQVTNLLTDTDAANGNVWTVGGTGLLAGLNLPIKPAVGDLRGSTIICASPGPSKQVVNTWAGTNCGLSTAGYTNNATIGKLILDALGASSSFKFNGTGASNALYVGCLELRGALTNGINSNYEFTNWLFINTNLMMYYGDAIVWGTSVAGKIEAASLNGKNGRRLRWVPGYVGPFISTTNIVYPDGKTYTFNAAAVQSPDIDSNGNGIPNASDPTPFFVPGLVDLTVTVTNNPSPTALITWNTVPNATNYLFYKTSPISTGWQVLTNIVVTSRNSVTVSDPVISPGRVYEVRVDVKQ